MSLEWWRNAVIYQIYPRSFQDSNNDGIGDLNGITARLDYIADLGVDGIWISPFFTSPMKDFGYDVSNYRDIDPIFGTLSDFDLLLNEAHKRKLKIIIDLVLSHTSDQHPWFIQSRKNKYNPFADWYVWADGKSDEHGNLTPPNNWVSVFGGGAWEFDETRKQYYFHNFLKEQPDLNYHNPHVQAEILDIARFWLERGVDGFRLDTVNFYFHDELLRDNPPRTHGVEYATQLEADVPYSRQQHIYDKSRPENIEFIKKLRALVDQYEGRMMVGEIGDDDPYQCAIDYTRGNDLLHTTYNTHLMTGTHKELTADLIREPIETFFKLQKEDDDSWPSWAFSNHDVVRAASRWFKPFESDPQFSKLLIALLGCLPGTLFLYQGEELGLPEAKIPFEEIKDPWAKETWPVWQGRDGCRTPMPWKNGQKFCGFSGNTPWLSIPETHITHSVDIQYNSRESVLNFTKQFLIWRNSTLKKYNNSIKIINSNNSKIIEIIIKNNTNETNCIFNISSQEVNYKERIFSAFEFSISHSNGIKTHSFFLNMT